MAQGDSYSAEPARRRHAVIIKGKSCSNGAWFAKHLSNTKDNEENRLIETRGLLAENVPEGFREMAAIASGTKVKNYFYHANINPPGDAELTEQQWQQAVDTLEKNLGLENQPRFVVEHVKNGRQHRHVIWSRIDADSMTAISDSQNYAVHEKTAKELALAFGWEPATPVHGREVNEKRPERRPKNWEGLRGSQTGLSPELVKSELTAMWQSADSGKAFHAAIEDRGYLLCQGDRRDFVVIDATGKEHSLARRLEGVRAAALRERLADVDREALPTVEEGKQRNAARYADNANKRHLRRMKLAREAAEYLRGQEDLAAKLEQAARAASRKAAFRQAQRRKQAISNQHLRDINRTGKAETVYSTAALTEGYTNKDFFERMEALRLKAMQEREAQNQQRADRSTLLRGELQGYLRSSPSPKDSTTLMTRAAEHAKLQAALEEKQRQGWVGYVQKRREWERER